MRAAVQRVNHAEVAVNGIVKGQCQCGYMVLLGVSFDDTEADAVYIADKIVNMRIFDDENGVMNLSIKDVGGSVLLVSQFTLYGDARKGRRPSYSNAAKGELANGLYELVEQLINNADIDVQTGVFGADMQVSLENDGPVTILLDSKRLF